MTLLQLIEMWQNNQRGEDGYLVNETDIVRKMIAAMEYLELVFGKDWMSFKATEYLLKSDFSILWENVK